MIVLLFALFVAVSIALIILGLSKPTESAQALLGFTFLFLLSFVVLGNNLEYKTGEQIDTQYTYLSDNITIDYTNQTVTDSYTAYDDTTGIFNTHRFGYFLAVGSVIGFIGVLVSLRGGYK